MRVHVSLCTALAVISASCTSAPAPRAEVARADTPVIDSAVIERTRKRRLDDVRAQLASNDGDLVERAAWRCGDERMTELVPDLCAAATAWSELDKKDDRAWRQESLLGHIFDALVLLDAVVSADELRRWIVARQNEGAVLVLAMRLSPPPPDLLLHWLDTEKFVPSADTCAAANELGAVRSTEGVRALASRARVRLNVDVVDPGAGANGRSRFDAALSRCSPIYVFAPWSPDGDAARIAGPIDIGRSRPRPGNPNDVGVSLRSGSCIGSPLWSYANGHTYATDVLAWLVDEPRFGAQWITVDMLDADPSLALALVSARVAAARETWTRVFAELVGARLLSKADAFEYVPVIDVSVWDSRARIDGIELPDFAKLGTVR